MNKQHYLSIAMGMLLPLFAACSSDDNLDKDSAKVDVTTRMEFPVTFADYNQDTEVGNTRAGANPSDTLNRKIVDMGNGIIADVTLRKDRENLSGRPTNDATTRTLPGSNSYTMLAYQGGVLKGEITGVISGNSFTPNAGGAQDISLEPGNYDFVLYPTPYFTRSGNTLTLNSPNNNAMLGRTNYTVTATPHKQQVPFEMKHAVARVKLNYITYIKTQQQTHSGFSLSAVNPAEAPNTATYDVATDTWSYSGSGGDLGFGGDAYVNPWLETGSYGSYKYQSSGYSYVIPGANVTNVKASFMNMKIYGEELNGKTITLALNPALATVANGSYIINITFRYNFLYLMSDGTTGLWTETTHAGGTKTPIAVVVSRSRRLAVALQNVDGGAGFYWRDGSIMYQSNSTVAYASLGMPGNPTDYDGYKWTWEASGSADGTTIKGDEQTKYPAFYAAGHYTPTLPAGVTLSGSIVGKKWHLPSISEVETAFRGLNSIPPSQNFNPTMYNYPLTFSPTTYYYNMMPFAFEQVGGANLSDTVTSTEITGASSASRYGRAIVLENDRFDLGEEGKVRPFIIY